MEINIILTCIFLFLMLSSINTSLFSNMWTDIPLIFGSPGFRNGLWSYCKYTQNGKLRKCYPLNNIPNKIKIVRTFTILGFIFGLLAAISAAVYKDKPYITAIFTIIVIICSIISLSVYSSLNKFPQFLITRQILIAERGVGYWANVSTIIFALVVTIISFVKFK